MEEDAEKTLINLVPDCCGENLNVCQIASTILSVPLGAFSMSTSALFAEIMKLPEADRLELMDRVDSSSPPLPLTECCAENGDYSAEFIAKLDAISKDIDEHPERLISWDELKMEIHARYGK